MATSLQSISIMPPAGGVRTDLLSDRLPLDALAASQNWIFRDGAMRTRNGLFPALNNISQRPAAYIFYQHNDGFPRLVQATTRGWFTNGWTDITGAALSGGPTDRQIFRVFDKGGVKYLLGTNGADTMKKWDGTSGTYSDVGGTPPRARCMMIINDRILLANLVTGVGAAVAGGSSYDISANIDFDSGWGETLSGILADTPGDIMAMLEMGGLRGAIYKSDAIYMVTATDGINPIAFELRQAGVEGPIGPLAVAALSDGLHVYLGRNGSLMQFDGINASTLGRPIQKYIAESISASADRSFLMWDPVRKELHVVYPEVGSTDPNLDLIVSFPSRAIWPQRWTSLRMTAGYFTYAGELLLGDVGGQSYEQSIPGIVGTSTDAGAAIPTFFETGLSDLGAPQNFKTLAEVDNLFDTAPATQLVTVKSGFSNYGELRTLDAGQTIDVHQPGPYVTGHRVTGRRHCLRLEATVTQPIVWHGANASLALRGLR